MLIICVQIFDRLGEAPYTVFSKQPRIALSTILFKCVVLCSVQLTGSSVIYPSFSCICIREPASSHLRTAHVALILEVRSLSSHHPGHLIDVRQILSTERAESEAAYRALVSLGNVVCSLFSRVSIRTDVSLLGIRRLIYFQSTFRPAN